MKTELLEKMLDAGFTKEEILSLSRGDAATASPVELAPVNPSPVDPSPETEETETAPETAPETTETEKPDALEARLNGIEKNISDLVKAMQMANLRNDSFNESMTTPEELADKALTEIIRPPRRERS